MDGKPKKKKAILIHKCSGTLENGTHFDQVVSTPNSTNSHYITYCRSLIPPHDIQTSMDTKIVAHSDEEQQVYYKPMPINRLYPFNLQSPNIPPQEYGSVTKLFEEIKDYHYQHWDYPIEAFYDLATAWTLATYFPEKWDFVGYIAAIGDTGTGKSRLLNTLAALSYRAWKVTDFTESPLFRGITAWEPTVFIDESETMTSGDKKSIQNLLNSGQKRGDMVPRSMEIQYGGKKDYEMQLFSLFGFKAIAGTRWWLPTLQRRSFIAFMTENQRDVKRKIDKPWAQQLRAKLLQYRIDFVDVPFKETAPKIDVLTKMLPNTVYELFFSLFSVTPSKKWDSLLKFANKEADARKNERTLSDSAEVFEAMIKVFNPQSKLIKLKEVTDYLNRDRTFQEQFTSKQVSQIVATLGFKKKRASFGMGIKWDAKNAKRLSEQYGIEIKEKPAFKRSSRQEAQRTIFSNDADVAELGE